MSVVECRWLAIALASGLVLAGCGSSLPRDPGPSRTVVEASFRGSPPALATLHRQADKLLAGGVGAFAARLKALRGHPVVVNLWASWCVPCETEFPVYQKVAVRDGRLVAFLGVDERDTRASALSWLRRFPVTYPSYVDDGHAIDVKLRTLVGTPQTFFFNARGVEQYDHGGSYGSVADLERDIRTYLHVG